MLDLNGVDKYKRYAEVQIETLGLVDKRSNLVKDFGAVISQVLQNQVAGQPIDEAAVTSSLQKIIDERNNLTKQIEDLNKEAVTLARELNLE